MYLRYPPEAAGGAALVAEHPVEHPDPTEHAVMTRSLVRRFGPVTAIDGIDLTIGSGEIYGFLGPNGAGKSSLVRVLCTLLRPHGGVAYVAGHDVVLEPQAVRIRIGVALQEAALDDRQSGRELLALQGRLYGLDRKQIQKRLMQVLELVDIGEAIDRRIATYSGGMKRRLDLAAALIHNPKVLFLDEPTTGLDPVSRSNVWNEIRRLNSELGMTILLTTQYLDEADVLAHRVGIIAQGRLVAEGTPGELKRAVGKDLIVAEVAGHDPFVLNRLEGLPGIDAVTSDEGRIVISTENGSAGLSPVAIALHETSLEVMSLTLRTPTLDDVFMELTGSHIGAGDGR